MIGLYAVLRKDGTIKTRKHERTLCVYRSLDAAKRMARADGDSVVTLEVDHIREPVFIRKRVLSGK